MKMRTVEFGFASLLLLAFVILSKAEVYIATIEGEPIVSYKGDVDGFEATAVESDEKIDTTRYSQSKPSHFHMYRSMYVWMYVHHVCVNICMFVYIYMQVCGINLCNYI